MKKGKLLSSLPEGNALSGLILITCTVFSLLFSNCFIGQQYVDFWHTQILDYSLMHIINDMLMTLFFLLVGLEIKKELLVGELSNKKKAFLPFACAVGGMAIPAIIFHLFNYSSTNSSGWGIPTATDIAFSIGILSILGSKIPIGLKVFLTALAIVDDLGAVVVIAIFYSKEISLLYLLIAISLTLLLFFTAKFLKLYHTLFSVFVGCIIWFFLDKAGMHGTIAGVLLAITIPLEHKSKKPYKEISNFLHKPVNYFITPLFAIANTALTINGGLGNALTSNISLGIILGLFVGKPVEILTAAFLSIKFNLAEMPKSVNWKLLFGVAMLAGIGFTMSMFISVIAYEDIPRQDTAKIAILVASTLSALAGIMCLKLATKPPPSPPLPPQK